MITTKLLGYTVEFTITHGECEFVSKESCSTMLEVVDFVDGLKERYGEDLINVNLTTHEKIMLDK